MSDSPLPPTPVAVRPRLVFGLGTGRCGTTSLTKLLQVQRWRQQIGHECWQPFPPWEFSAKALDRQLGYWEKLPATVQVAGDVAFYLLPYVRKIAAARPDAKFVCLKRLRHLTVQSFVECERGRDLWSSAHGKSKWHQHYASMPKYPVHGLANALGVYWDDYYSQAEQLAKEMPERFRIFRTWDLNGLVEVEQILDFLDVPILERVLAIGIRGNRR